MDENAIAKEIVDAAFHIHVERGPGLLESAHETILENELKQRGLSVQRQVKVPIEYHGLKIAEGFRIDLLINGKVLVELKSVERAHPVHKKQVLTYLRLMNLRLGLLINFGVPLIRDGIERISNGMN